jgi:hypothetical protein
LVTHSSVELAAFVEFSHGLYLLAIPKGTQTHTTPHQYAQLHTDCTHAQTHTAPSLLLTLSRSN